MKYKFILFLSIIYIVLTSNITYGTPYTMCNGVEFNARVMSLLSGGDPNANKDTTVTKFEKGDNLPSDPAFYVDISEDMDGTVLAYVRNSDPNAGTASPKTLYYYSDSQVFMNDNASYMFSGFVNMKIIDLTELSFLNDLHDVRYMFANCRRLKTIRFKKTDTTPLNLTETQGMFFNCQSLSYIDFRFFTTYHVDNMDEMFYRCFNLRNIYVYTERWNVENVRTFRRMFSDCYVLKTNDGRKAVDIPFDDYEKYAVVGNDSVEGLLKDANLDYDDYGAEEDDIAVPLEDAGYLITRPETIARYAYEPEKEGIESEEGSPYVGDSSTGYGATKETGQSASIYGAETEAIVETSIIESVEETISETISETFDTIESETYENENLEIDESSGRRIVEIDGIQNEESTETIDENIDEPDRTKFLIFALIVSVVVILLLLGMVMYLFKDNNNKT